MNIISRRSEIVFIVRINSHLRDNYLIIYCIYYLINVYINAGN